MANDELNFGWRPEELQRVEPNAPALEGVKLQWPERTPREEFELRAMQHFNKRRAFWRHIVDGGELGILLLDNDGNSWTKTWIELEQLPATEEKRVGEKRGGESGE